MKLIENAIASPVKTAVGVILVVLFGGLNFSARQVVTVDTIPASGTEIAPPPPGDYEEFFRAKWCAEFTNLPNC